MAEQGFTTLAKATLCENGAPRTTLSATGYDFLKTEFPLARDRMASLATTVGTTGSFLLAILALLVGFATGVGEESDELVAASEKASLLAAQCVEDSTTPECTEQKLAQAQAAVERERGQVGELQDLNTAQALVGAAALLGFLLGLCAHLTNPVAGPRAHEPPANGVDGRVEAWLAAVSRLKLKRRWIEAAALAQAVGVVAVFYLAYEVFF